MLLIVPAFKSFLSSRIDSIKKPRRIFASYRVLTFFLGCFKLMDVSALNSLSLLGCQPRREFTFSMGLFFWKERNQPLTLQNNFVNSFKQIILPAYMGRRSKLFVEATPKSGVRRFWRSNISAQSSGVNEIQQSRRRNRIGLSNKATGTKSPERGSTTN